MGFEFCNFAMKFSVYFWPTVLSLNNLKIYKKKKHLYARKIYL